MISCVLTGTIEAELYKHHNQETITRYLIRVFFSCKQMMTVLFFSAFLKQPQKCSEEFQGVLPL